jgi:hypothetical protein
MPRVDLDAFLAEQNADPLVITFKGRDFEAPAEIPWAAYEKAQDLHGRDLEREDTRKLIGEIISLFLGKEAWLYMEAHGIGPKASMKLVNALMEQLMASLPKDVDPKLLMEAALERRGSPSPSASETPANTSPSLRPISGGSITLGRLNSAESA